MKAVFLDRQSLDLDDLNFESVASHCQFESYPKTPAGQGVIERLQGAQIAIVNKVVLDAPVLKALPQLKLICVAATGTNNVDLAYCHQHGIVVTNCRGYGTASVVQHTLGLMLALATSQPQYSEAVRRGDWCRSEQFCLLDYPIMELAGKVLGIIGYGELGQGVAAIARALGMRVLVAARPGTVPAGERLSLEELLSQVDLLSLHCPLTEQTRNLIDAQALALMKPSAMLVNAARGGIVDEQALAEALRSGRLAGAATDVLSVEPPNRDNPLLANDIPNLIITPHSAWGSREARQRIVEQIADNIAGFLKGAPVRLVC